MERFNLGLPLLIPFSIALFFTLFSTAFFPQIPLFAFAPFLAILYQRRSFLPALWIAALCGLSVDLCTSELPFGIQTLHFCAITVCVHRYKRQFFEDRALSLFFFTLLISITSSFTYLLLASLFQKGLPFSIQMNLFLTPLVNGIYAFLCFSCPMKAYVWARRKQFSIFSKR